MSQKAVAVGRGSLAAALAAATGLPMVERPPEPTITVPCSEDAFRDRLVHAADIATFRETLRRELSQHPDMRDEMLTLATRFDSHPGYGKLVVILTDIKTEMEKPEFDFGDPARLRRWINWMFNRKSPQT